MSEEAGLRREVAMLREVARASVLLRKLGKAVEACDDATAQYWHDNPDATRSLSMSLAVLRAYDDALAEFDAVMRKATGFYAARGEEFAHLISEEVSPALRIALSERPTDAAPKRPK